MKRIFGFFSREISGIHHAAYILAISSLSSQLLALFRDRLLASSFGASFNLDLYYSAFRIPDLLFATVGSLVSASVLLPTVAEKFSKNKNDLKNFLDSIFSFYLVIILFTAILLIFISPFLLSKLFPSIKGQDFKLLVILTRILLFSPVFLGLSNLLSSIVQIHQRFLISALSPILYNIGIIFGILFMYPFFGTKGLVLGVVFGAVLHFLIQVPFVLKEGFFPKLIFKNINQSVKKIFYISLPRTITVSSAEISELFLISFASFLTVGSISIFNLSFNLQSVPFSIIGVSYAIAIFPTLSKHFACKELESFLEKIIKTSSHIIFWSIPATVFIFIFRVQIVSLLLGAGKFDTLAIYLTGGALAIFSLSLLFQNMSVLFIRIFYAQGKTKEPLFINVFGALVIIFSSYFFANLFDKSLAFKNIIENIFNIKSVENIKVLTLSIGYSFGTFVSWFIYLVMVSKQFKGYLKAIYKTFLETLLASFVSGLIAYKLSVLQSSSKFTLMVLNIPAVLFAILSFVIVLLLFKNREIKEVLKSFSGRFYKSEIPKVTD